MSSSAADLSLPFRKDFPDFRLPSKIHLIGHINDGATRFEVNILSQSGEHLLHFNPRFAENCVVRNCTQGGQWQSAEERDGGLPFSAGQPFLLDFSVEEGQIVCSVNGSPFCEFAARDDLSQVAAVTIDGDIRLNSVELSSTAGNGGAIVQPVPDQPPSAGGGQEPPVSLPDQHPTEPTPHQPQPQPHPPTSVQGPQGALPIPYEAPLQTLLQTNRMRIVGIPHAGAQRFTVNFKDANGESLFHFNPRFDQNCVVRNATVNRQYPPDGEEREGTGCPFQSGRQFALDFLIHGNIIRCFVDGIEFCRFQLRGDLSQVATLDIHGDLALNQVLIA